MQTIEISRPLKKQEDRCDKCRAEAYVIAEKAHMTLLFCGHHGRQYQAPLELQGWSLLDFTDEIR
jgi:hypothetical protein